MKYLDARELRAANVMRCNAKFFSIDTWTPQQWMLAMVGECGETANVLKKRLRGDDVPDVKLADEFADVAIYMDLAAEVMMVAPWDLWGQTAAPVVIADEAKAADDWIDWILYLVTQATGVWHAARFDKPTLAAKMLPTVAGTLTKAAAVCGVDLGSAIVTKFNATSIKLNWYVATLWLRETPEVAAAAAVQG